jgi:transcriptional regulator with XRE-family HTH domain
MHGRVSAVVGRQAFGKRLGELRRARGLTLGDVGRSVGVSASCVCQWERGRSFPRVDHFDRLAEAVGTTVDHLIAGRPDRAPAKTAASSSAVLTAPQVIFSARREIARALGVEVSKVRVIVE